MLFAPAFIPSHLRVVFVSTIIVVIGLRVGLLLFLVSLFGLFGLVPVMSTLPFILLVIDKITVLVFVLPHGFLSDQVLRANRGHRGILSPQDKLPSRQAVQEEQENRPGWCSLI